MQCVQEMKYNVKNINKVKNTVKIKGTLFGQEFRVGSADKRRKNINNRRSEVIKLIKIT